MSHPSRSNKRAWKLALEENVLHDLKRLLGLDPGLLECKFEFFNCPHGPMTALQFACKNDWWEASLWLLDQGARPSGILKSKQSSLGFAVEGEYFVVVERLLEAGSTDFDTVSVFGNSPLHAAVELEDGDMVKALLGAGADPTVRNGSGLTSLDLARNSQSDEMMDALRSALANEQAQVIAAKTVPAIGQPRRKGL